ncbi:MAG TPA: helix-turn-helix domain-containing protein [Pirellulaceae bacterium]|nr:helix-turn-helix domain-containing protein [Pirellulaceae bacterium]
MDLTIAQAAERLAVSANTVRRYIERAQLPARDASPLGSSRKMYRIREEDVAKLSAGHGTLTEKGWFPESEYQPKHLL